MFTVFLSEYEDSPLDEVAISIRLQCTRDAIYRTELLRQITAFSLEEYLTEREIYFESLNDNEEEEEEEEAEDNLVEKRHPSVSLSSPRHRGFFSTLLWATVLTRDVKVLRSVNSLCHSIGLYPACAVLQRVLVKAAR